MESIIRTLENMLGLEDHRAREPHPARQARRKFLALTAAIALNHRLGARPATSPPTTRDRSVERRM